MKTCRVEGCGRDTRTRTADLCTMHYQRKMRNGDPTVRLIPETFEERFWSKVIKTEACWNWTGALGGSGYGVIKRNAVQGVAHRFSYEMKHGQIPEGALLDHKCRNRTCVNPDHLRPVTNKQNMENLAPEGHAGSGARGVCWHPQRGKWLARVGHNMKSIYVGHFDNFEEAKAAVISKRLELHQFNDTDRRVAA